MSTLKDLIPAGVILGDDVQKVFAYAKAHQFALPAVNCTGTNTVNACLETAAELGSPMIIQFSNGGAAFYAGKALSNTGQRAAIAGAVAGAMHVHQLAEAYGARVLVHTDHCAKKLLPWVDGLLDAGEAYYQAARQAAFQLAHAGSLRTVAHRECRDLQALSGAHEQAGHDPGARTGRHRRRGRWRGQHRRQQLAALHAA